MNYLQIGVYFWFDICDNELKVLESLKEKFIKVFSEYDYEEIEYNEIYIPSITAYNESTKSSMSFSKICCQYHQEGIDNIDEFRNNALELYNILSDNNIKVLYTSSTLSSVKKEDLPLNKFKEVFNSKIDLNDLLEVNLKVTSIIDNQYTSTINIINNKQVGLTKMVDSKDRDIPYNLLSLGSCEIINEGFIFEYELSDRYLFDTTNDYSTSYFHVNKLLFTLKDNFLKEISKYLDLH